MAAAFAVSLLAHAGTLAVLGYALAGADSVSSARAALRVDLPRAAVPAPVAPLAAVTPEPAPVPMLPSGAAGGGAEPNVDPEPLAAAVEDFYPNAVLDLPAVPLGKPNPRKYLTHTDLPSVLFRLRLYVDSTGNVVKVELIEPAPFAESAIQPVKDMFQAVLFVPGKLNGRNVGSTLDIEVLLEEVMAESAARAEGHLAIN